MFQGDAEQAVDFQVSLFPGGRIVGIVHDGPGEPDAGGRSRRRALPSSAFSLVVDCESGEEIQQRSAALAEGGGVLMPLGDYGFSRRFAWVNDRYGVS